MAPPESHAYSNASLPETSNKARKWALNRDGPGFPGRRFFWRKSRGWTKRWWSVHSFLIHTRKNKCVNQSEKQRNLKKTDTGEHLLPFTFFWTKSNDEHDLDVFFYKFLEPLKTSTLKRVCFTKHPFKRTVKFGFPGWLGGLCHPWPRWPSPAGYLGDCWLVASFSALAEYPDRVRSLVQVDMFFFGFFGSRGVGIDRIFQTFFGTAAALTRKQWSVSSKRLTCFLRSWCSSDQSQDDEATQALHVPYFRSKSVCLVPPKTNMTRLENHHFFRGDTSSSEVVVSNIF